MNDSDLLDRLERAYDYWVDLEIGAPEAEEAARRHEALLKEAKRRGLIVPAPGGAR